MYAVKESNGELDFKIGQNDFPEKLFINALIDPKADGATAPLGSQEAVAR